MEECFFGWRLGDVISTGQFTEVREATSEIDGRSVILKRLHAHAAREPAVRALFEAECDLTCALPRSPHLVHGLAADVALDRPYLVLDRRGHDLRSRLEAGTLGRLDGFRLLVDAATGVAHLHHHGWVHGDLNPSNLLCDRGRGVICDLGVARRLGDGGPVRGTAAYMAPEQVRGGGWTAAVDVFALGVLLWELASGVRLFHRGPSFLSMAAVIETEAPPLDEVELAPIAANALAKDPAARPSARAFATALDQALAPR